MDLITLDVSDVPEALLTIDTPVDLLDATQTVDDLAATADTIGYEVLTSLGRRYHRRYLGEATHNEMVAGDETGGKAGDAASGDVA